MSRSTIRRRLVTAVAALTTITLAGALVSAPATADSRANVWGPNSAPYGTTYGEWSARWWQWAYSVPASVNPLLDATGVNCGQGQQGKVFFLAGVLNESGTANRTCNVPAGKALLFPVINAEWDNYLCGPDATYTVDELREIVDGIVDTATDLSATVDGVGIDIAAFRFTSPTFDITVPDDNLCSSVDGTPAGTYGPAVADGYYVMLKPLSAGDHTVSFGGSFPDFGFTLSITYDLHVS